MKKLVVSVIGAVVLGSASAQWLPSAVRDVAFDPKCDSNRAQVRVVLEVDTDFLMLTNLPKGTLLYAVNFLSQRQNSKGQRISGTAYCAPYQKRELGFFASYSTKNEYAAAVRNGFDQCLFDFNDDGIFDDANGSAIYYSQVHEISRSHQYRYTVLQSTGIAEVGCPRGAGELLRRSVWDALTKNEQSALAEKKTFDVITDSEVGILIETQTIDESTSSTSGGAAIGGAVAEANYIEKSIADSNYSAKGQLGAAIGGQLLGSILFDKSGQQAFKKRFVVKSLDGELRAADKMIYTKEFGLTAGTCVTFPRIDKISQNVCESTVATVRAKYFPESTRVDLAGVSKELRLRELKALFEKGLISEAVYIDRQQKILTE